jgi:NifU-like protein involved in Fe-S cluster formation
MSASAAQSLYSRDILRLATSLPYDDRIDPVHASATHRAPVCGSEMSVDVALEDGTVAAIAIRARACALGQASATILRDRAIGQTAGEIALLAKQLAQALKGEAEMPSEFQALAYARDYPARHGAILLPLETLLTALSEIAPP